MRRNRRRKKYGGLIVGIILVLFLCIGLVYMLFIKPLNISCGIVVNKKETPKTLSLELYYNGASKWIKVSKNMNIPESIAYNVYLKGMRVISISPSKVYTGKVLSKSRDKVELDTVSLALNPEVLYYKFGDKGVVPLPSSSVIVGYSTYKFISDEYNRVAAVFVEPPEITYLRIGISNADFSSFSHPSIIFSSKKGLILKTDAGDYKAKKGESFRADFKDNSIYLSLYKNNKDTLEKVSDIGTSKGRIYVSSASQDPISIPTIKRSSGYVPLYYGTMEVSVDNNSLKLINEVAIEDYLRFVVPSEMPRYGGIEGYKVQAIAARTYALSDTLSGRFAKYGFNLDDTVSSQAYNAQPSNSICDTAIEDTKGIVLTYNGTIIDAKYCSTSCGVSAPFNEIWFNTKEDLSKNPEPYLDFRDFTNTGIKDLSSEEAASSFLKDWTVSAYDSNSPYFRWKMDMDKTVLTKTINENIYNRASKNPDFFKKKWYFNIYRKANIPKDGIGNISDIYISKRGKSGIIIEAVIVSDTGEYKITREANIRNVLTPRTTSFEITPIYGDKIKNPSRIPSGFFVIDKQIVNNKLKGITLYGGGFGDGAGMSQYGVIGLVRQGRKYDEILRVFYKDIDLKNYKDIIKSTL